MEKISCAFGVFDMDDNLIGWRQDTFNTLGFPPKIYPYTPEQVDIVLKNIEDSMNGAGTKVMKALFEKSGQENVAQAVEQVEKSEAVLQEMGSYRVKVYEVPPVENRSKENPWGEYPNLDMWKYTYASQQPLKVYKFKLK